MVLILSCLQGTIASFYDDDEIGNTKKTLHDILVQSLGDNEAPYLSARKPTYNKRKMDAEDLTIMYAMIDEKRLDLPKSLLL